MKILIAEDDLSVCAMLELFFQKEGFHSVFVHSGRAAEESMRTEDWDLVILDWMLPGKNGLDLCKDIRQAGDTPIILLTAKDGEAERIHGLETGADDYVTKPFSPMELIARIKAVMRRYKGSSDGSTGEEESSERLIHKQISIELPTRQVTINGQPVGNLTPKEFELLCLFVKHPRRVFTREQFLELVWGYDYFGEERTVDVHIKRLRNKVSTPEHPLISTVWGVGYKLED